ncbi:MAG: hypothetical protein KC931_20415, partial [Candidatus Omnitrophica bacterium]|nr:hypothetical protein [Candidatus Omnitrophota bacterium]
DPSAKEAIVPEWLESGKIPIEFAPPTSNRIRVGYRFGFGATARFRDSVSYHHSFIDRDSSFGQDSLHQRNSVSPGIYDDGYVLTDSSGNAGGKTWFWGYENNAQVNGGSIDFSRQVSQDRNLSAVSRSSTTYDLRATPLEITQNQDGPSQGVELVFEKDLLAFGRFTLGAEAGFSFQRLEIASRQRVQVPITINTRERRTTTSHWSQSGRYQVDSYALTGVIPPLGPYSGSSTGPGPMIAAGSSSTLYQQRTMGSGSSSSSQTTTRTSLMTGNQSGIHTVDAEMYSLRFGPVGHFQIGERLSAAAGAGLLLNFVNADLSYSETLSIPGIGGRSDSARKSESELLPGGYVEARLHYQLCEALSVYSMAQLNFSDDFEASVGSKAVTVDFGTTYYFGIGIELQI